MNSPAIFSCRYSLFTAVQISAGVVEPPAECPFNCSWDISIGHDDHRVGASQLQRECLKMIAGERAYPVAGRTVPGKGDLLYFRVTYQRLSNHLSRPGHDIEHAGWQTGFLQQSGYFEVRERCRGRRLEDKAVARKQCRPHLPAHNEHRHIPGNDRAADTEWNPGHQAVPGLTEIYCLTGRLPGDGGIVFEDVCAPPHLVYGFVEWFSLLPGQEALPAAYGPGEPSPRRGREGARGPAWSFPTTHQTPHPPLRLPHPHRPGTPGGHGQQIRRLPGSLHRSMLHWQQEPPSR